MCKIVKRPVRKLHINGEEWHYIVDWQSARVFPPNSKSCMAEVSFFQFSFTPSELKSYILKYLAPVRGAWIASGKPVLKSNHSLVASIGDDDFCSPTFVNKQTGAAERLLEKWSKTLGWSTKGE